MRIVQRNAASSGWLIFLMLTIWVFSDLSRSKQQEFLSSPVVMVKAALMYRKLHLEDGTCEKFKAGLDWLTRSPWCALIEQAREVFVS